MISLSKLGLKEGMIFEAIITTSSNGLFNAAPMGVRTEDFNVIVKPYKSSKTYRNLVQNKCAVINFTDNPKIFLRTALKNEQSVLPKTIFYKARNVDAPRLKNADAYLEVTVTKVEDESPDRASFTLNVNHVEVVNPYFHPYCRSSFAVIEAIIHATRIRFFLSKGMTDEADALIEKVEYYKKLTERVSPNSEYTRIMNRITENISKWREKDWESPF